MKDFVSRPWTSVLGLAASMSAVYAALVQCGFPGAGLVVAGLALAAAVPERGPALARATQPALKGRGTP